MGLLRGFAERVCSSGSLKVGGRDVYEDEALHFCQKKEGLNGEEWRELLVEILICMKENCFVVNIQEN